ncbi:hypothetical protein ANN_12980 [Periplaneta americana]|uniref:Uncharacterized protein n=1 Tax=Periplaneta americana TaxID=6978 RepID=A0ABQ8TKB9_PERAM|nr:hypothetical protein ANN_12980 [Periplaneta americana]
MPAIRWLRARKHVKRENFFYVDIDALIYRLNKCLDKHGDYVENASIRFYLLPTERQVVTSAHSPPPRLDIFTPLSTHVKCQGGESEEARKSNGYCTSKEFCGYVATYGIRNESDKIWHSIYIHEIRVKLESNAEYIWFRKDQIMLNSPNILVPRINRRKRESPSFTAIQNNR